MLLLVVVQVVLIQSACNAMTMYSDVNYTDDGSCTSPDAGYDCDGVCLADADGDGVCDEFEIAGCQDDVFLVI